MQIDTEKIISLKPDAVLAASSEVGEFKQVQSAGIPVLQDLDYLESTPLARAEWMKAYGILLNKEGAATKSFDSIAERYAEVAKKAKNGKGAPHTIVARTKKKLVIVSGRSHPELAADVDERVAVGVEQFGGERPGPDAGGVRLGDADHPADVAGPEAGARARPARRRV